MSKGIRGHIVKNFPLVVTNYFRAVHPQYDYIGKIWDTCKTVGFVSGEYRRVLKIHEYDNNKEGVVRLISTKIEGMLMDIADSQTYKDHPSSLYSLSFVYDYEITFHSHSSPGFFYLEVAIDPVYKRTFCGEWHKFGEDCDCFDDHSVSAGGECK